MCNTCDNLIDKAYSDYINERRILTTKGYHMSKLVDLEIDLFNVYELIEEEINTNCHYLYLLHYRVSKL
jgi:hypothetical protein